MGNKVVVYQSNTGYTKRYAEWIAKELGCELKENKKLKASELEAYDTIIYGGFILAGKISGVDLIKQNLDAWNRKKMIVFATGFAKADEAVIQKVRDDNFKTEECKQISLYYFRGGFDYQQMKFMHKMMMKMMVSQLKKENPPSEGTKEMLAAMEHPVDFCKQEYLKPLIREVTVE